MPMYSNFVMEIPLFSGSFDLDNYLCLLSESNESSSGFGSITSVEEIDTTGSGQPEPVSHFSDTTASTEGDVTGGNNGDDGQGPDGGGGGGAVAANDATAGSAGDDGYHSETLHSGNENHNSNSSDNQQVNATSSSSHSSHVSVEERSQEFNRQHRPDPSQENAGAQTTPLPQGEFPDDDRARVQRMPVSVSDNTNLGWQVRGEELHDSESNPE